MSQRQDTTQKNPIVSSEHLSHQAEELSEFEFGLTMASHAFNRWIVRCMTAANVHELSALDILVLHSVNHRKRAKRQNDLCLVLNVEDAHTVTYALKKLLKHGLVSTEKRGKEMFYSITSQGQQACLRYAEIRESCLIDSLESLGLGRDDLHKAAGMLRTLSGLYDQAARAAATL